MLPEIAPRRIPTTFATAPTQVPFTKRISLPCTSRCSFNCVLAYPDGYFLRPIFLSSPSSCSVCAQPQARDQCVRGAGDWDRLARQQAVPKPSSFPERGL